MLKNSDGQKSSSFTMMIVSFTVVTLWLLLSTVEGFGSIKIRAFSGSDAMAYLTPILALYWGRRKQQQDTTNTSTSLLPSSGEEPASTNHGDE